MNTTLIINPELKDLLPPLSKEELNELETNIKEHGCLTQLLVWGDTIVDGHNRYEICSRLGLPFDIKKIEFNNISEAKFWIWQHQKGRRNVNAFLRGEMALTFKDAIVAKARARQRGGQGGILLCQNSDKAKKIDTKKVLAKSAEVSHDTLLKIEFLLQHADEETKSKLRSTKRETSINKEHNRLKAELDAQKPKTEKKARSKSTTASEQNRTEADSRKTRSSSSEEKTKAAKTETKTAKPDPEPTATSEAESTTSDDSSETVVVSLKSHRKVEDKYCCGTTFEPDPDDDYFDWITEEERKELRAMQGPNRMVPPIHNFTIQNIPEHSPEPLLTCLYALFKVGYRKKLAYGLLRKMFEDDDAALARSIVAELHDEFQNR